MKKIGFLALCLLLPLTAFSFDWCYRGLDLSLGIGGSALTFNERISSSGGITGDNIGKIGFALEGKAGISAQVCNCWLLGVNGFCQYNSQSVDFVDVVELSMPWDAGVEGKVGYFLNPCNLIYGLIGPVWSNVKWRESNDNARENISHFGYRVGGGAEQRISRCFYMSETVTYASFDKKNIPGSVVSSTSPRLFSAIFALGWIF